MTDPQVGVLMLALFVFVIMLGFPIAFSLMAMGVGFAFYYFDFREAPVFALVVRKTFEVMSNEVLLPVPLFLFMGYVVERADILNRLFRSIQVAAGNIPASLAIATLATCALFATATGIVGAVVTLMGLLAFPAMLRAGYNVKVSAGVITAGGCLGILIPPSVMLIVYGATAGVSVVQLYAGAFFPGIMLAGLYIAYVIILAKVKPEYAPPLTEKERYVEIPPHAAAVAKSRDERALPGLWRGMRTAPAAEIRRKLRTDYIITVLPAIAFVVLMGLVWNALTKPNVEQDYSGLEQMGGTG